MVVTSRPRPYETYSLFCSVNILVLIIVKVCMSAREESWIRGFEFQIDVIRIIGM